MAVTATQLTAITSGAGGTPGTSFATPSITPSANKLVLAAVTVFKAGGCTAPTSVTGNGLTWVKVIEHDLSAVGFVNTSLWRAMGPAPSAGVVTANFGSTHSSCCIIVSEHGGVETTGSDGANAVRSPTSAEASGSSAVALTLPAFAHVDNGVFAAVSTGSLRSMTAGSGFALLGDAFEFLNNLRILSEWKASNDTSVDGTLSGTTNWTALAVELVASGPPPVTKSYPPVGARRHRPNLWSKR